MAVDAEMWQPHGWTALHLAARNNEAEVVGALHDAKCDLEQKDLMVSATTLTLIVNGCCGETRPLW